MDKKTILLIQSTETQGNGTKRHLEERGHEVLWAASGLTALMMATKQTVNLIILDVALPDIEGLDLCYRFRQRQDTHSIPIILLTAFGYQPDRASNRAHGPDDYLSKPYEECELDDRIVAVLETRGLTERAEEQPLTPTQSPELVSKPYSGAAGQVLSREPKPALITVAQQAAKPEPELASQSESSPIYQTDRLPAGKPDIFHDKDRERRPVLKAVPRLDLRSATRLEPRPHETPHLAPTAKEQREESPAKGSVPTQDTAVNPQQDTAPLSPLLPFKVTGDAVVDPATGLFGRPQFEAMFSKEFKRAVRFKQQMSCMLINMDGHKMGRRADEALVKAVIGLVQKTIREVDTAAWWSGESFIVLLPNTLRTDAMQAAARTLEVVANHPFTWPDSTKVTMSIGVAGLPDKNIDNEQKMIEVADMACKRAQEFAVPPQINVHALRR
jgi:diguanylate cyclase (GGDEF)-like protein